MFDLGLILVLRQCSLFVLRSAKELLVRGLVRERSLTSRLNMAEPLAGASKLDHVTGGQVRCTAGQQVVAQGKERTAAAFVHLALHAARFAAAVHGINSMFGCGWLFFRGNSVWRLRADLSIRPRSRQWGLCSLSWELHGASGCSHPDDDTACSSTRVGGRWPSPAEILPRAPPPKKGPKAPGQRAQSADHQARKREVIATAGHSSGNEDELTVPGIRFRCHFQDTPTPRSNALPKLG